MNGIINVYKEQGYTSHDVVAKLRGILRQRRIGHTGTLDPAAEGVLPVCLGTATKLCDLFTDKTKVYRASVVFGVATDTEDMTGTVIKELPVTSAEEDLRAVLPSFLGTTVQIPPMYSAIKVEGRKLYELAREGRTVERKGREVTIDAIDLQEVSVKADGTLSEAVLEVACGKGTYIRSLCRDLGERLGTCACMKSLIRLRSGDFCIEHAMRLSEIEEAVKNQTLEKAVVSVETVFAGCGQFRMKPEWDKLLQNGNRLPEYTGQYTAADKASSSFPPGWVRAYNSRGLFCGIYEHRAHTREYVPVKMFLEQ